MRLPVTAKIALATAGAIYIFCLIALIIVGSGPFALDQTVTKRLSASPRLSNREQAPNGFKSWEYFRR
jgi:hypothetical protein